MRFLLSIAVMFSLPVAVPARVVNDHLTYQTDALVDEYLVYDAAIGEMFVGIKNTGDTSGKIGVRLLAIEDHTVVYPANGLGPDQNLGGLIAPSLHPETLADYRTRSRQPAMLKRSFNIQIGYVLVGSEESKRAVYEMQGGRLDRVTLSRVGFNNAHTEALVYMGYECGGLCAEGFALFLVKESGGWKVDKKGMLWES